MFDAGKPSAHFARQHSANSALCHSSSLAMPTGQMASESGRATFSMIVTDLDRTLLRSDLSISDYSKGVFKKCREKGIFIAFATARSEIATRDFQEMIPPDYIISNNGAILYKNGKIVRETYIPQTELQRLIDRSLSEEKITCLSLDVGNDLYFNRKDSEDAIWNPLYTDFSEPVLEPVSKVSVECSDYSFAARLLEDFPTMRLFSSTGDNWHMIMSDGVSKAEGVRFITADTGISMEQVVAFGDDFNDVCMLEAAGTGVAMANAIPQAKAVADFVTAANDEDGVARFIEAHLL